MAKPTKKTYVTSEDLDLPVPLSIQISMLIAHTKAQFVHTKAQLCYQDERTAKTLILS